MSKLKSLDTLLVDGLSVHQSAPDIYSVIPEESVAHHYDRTALIYDKLIGNALYNRALWGNWPSAYAAFCSEALESSPDGYVLDAGCGTLVFTAREYLRHTSRPIVLLDRSIGMLQRARARLLALHNEVPAHIILLQGDLTALPFKANSFTTVLSWGTIHLFDEPVPILKALTNATSADGRLFLTSLISGRRLGTSYLKLLACSGEVAQPIDADMLVSKIAEAGLVPSQCVIGNITYCSAVKSSS
jgi:SAM-dependent methyltransferase